MKGLEALFTKNIPPSRHLPSPQGPRAHSLLAVA